MATVRCPACADEITPIAVEPEEGATQYLCPSCRRPLTVDVVDEYVTLEDEEAPG